MKKGIVFNEKTQKNTVDFNLCNYKIERIALNFNDCIFLNAPTKITNDVIFEVLEVNDSFNLIQKLELSTDQNVTYLRLYDFATKTFKNWNTPDGNGGGTGGDGVTSIVVKSNDNTIKENTTSVYDKTLKQITINISAIFTGLATEAWVLSKNYLTKAIQKVTSANSDITATTTNDNVELKLNSGNSANQIVKFDENAKYPSNNIDNTTVTFNSKVANIKDTLSKIYSTATFSYSNYFYVDPKNGVDDNTVNNGSLNSPFKTVAYTLTIAPTASTIVLLGSTAETALTITKPNIDIVTLGNRSALSGFANKVTINNTTAGSSIRFSGIAFNGGFDIASTNVGGVYVYNGQIGTNGFNKNNANGYCEFVGVDASNGSNNIKGGVFFAAGGKLTAPTITGTSTQVFIDDVGSIFGNSTVANTCYLFVYEQNWVANSSGFAISSVVGSFVFIENSNFARPDGTLSTLSILGYRSFSNCNYNNVGSSFSTDSLVVSSIDFFDKIGFAKKLSTVTTATKMLVLDSNNEICEQLIPTSTNIPIQFNIPASSIYCPLSTATPISIKSTSGGTTQTTQLAQVCNSSALMQIDQTFAATVESGKTLNYKGQMTVYNISEITQSNYYAVVQPIGAMENGQWVNIGESKNVTIDKTANAYTRIKFSGSFLNVGSSSIAAIGVRIQILYGQKDATSIIDTFFMEGSIS